MDPTLHSPPYLLKLPGRGRGLDGVSTFVAEVAGADLRPTFSILSSLSEPLLSENKCFGLRVAGTW
jgi:hypothetical protein